MSSRDNFAGVTNWPKNQAVELTDVLLFHHQHLQVLRSHSSRLSPRQLNIFSSSMFDIPRGEESSVAARTNCSNPASCPTFQQARRPGIHCTSHILSPTTQSFEARRFHHLCLPTHPYIPSPRPELSVDSYLQFTPLHLCTQPSLRICCGTPQN